MSENVNVNAVTEEEKQKDMEMLQFLAAKYSMGVYPMEGFTQAQKSCVDKVWNKELAKVQKAAAKNAPAVFGQIQTAAKNPVVTGVAGFVTGAGLGVGGTLLMQNLCRSEDESSSEE